MRSKKTTHLVGWLTGLVSTVLMGYWVVGYPNFLLTQPARLLLIEPGTTFNQVQEKLTKESFVNHPISFAIVAHLLQYPQKVIPGAYRIEQGMNNFQVIKILKKGRQHPVKITLHDIANKNELALKITQPIQIDPVDFEKLLNDSTFLASYGFTVDNVLSMFIPNTYEVYWTIGAESLFKKMYREYQQFWNKERLIRAQAIPLTPIQVYILASIVVKETNRVEDYPLIAGVYINRLKVNMFLQACPTALYAANQLGKVKKVLYSHLRFDSPYNTYRYKGLPPGPITMPSIAAIDAVLAYQVHDYLYFVAQDQLSNKHHFATTFKQHQYYVGQYKKACKKTIPRSDNGN